MPSRNMTNTELLAHLMEFSRSGVMTQLVVCEAIQKYCQGVADAPEGFMANVSAMIDESSWRRACAEILDAFSNRDKFQIEEIEEED